MARTREAQFGEATRPLSQRALREPKGQPTQDRWIVIVCHDEFFHVRDVGESDESTAKAMGQLQELPYDQLWAVLSNLRLGGRKAWLIGWRVRYAMDKADFVGALERGDVALPRVKIGKNKGKHGGKLTWTKRILEVDIVACRSKIKVLDWSNFGVEPNGYVDRLEDLTPEIAETSLRDFLGMAERVGVSVCKSTAAQLGWDHCRRLIGSAGLHVNLDPESRAMERRAYHGGRNEAFRLGDISGTTYSLDVKSCYAAICRDCELPARCIEEYRSGIEVGRIDADGCDHWIADVVIKTESPDYPLRWNGTPIYPVGEFATALAWPELRHALRLERVTHVMRAARYEAEYALKDYAAWYLCARSHSLRGYAQQMSGAIKSIFNGSLGYTAREKYDWQPWDCQLGHKYWLGTCTNPEDQSGAVAAQVLDGERRWLRVAGEPYEAMPFLHATICSWARVKLLDIFDAAGRGNVLYCDTDGVLLTEGGIDRMASQSMLMGCKPGQLTERFAPGEAWIGGQKAYRIGANVIAAGVTKLRRDGTLKKTVLTTATGLADSNGVVSPFRFACEQLEGGMEKFLNIIQ